MEIGIYSFVENTPVAGSEKPLPPAQRLQYLMEEIELADQVGLDVFGIGEHHREEYISSAPSVLLSAAAARTKQIRLSSAVTVLGSEDPVRVYQQFATLDLLSGGRAEIMAGRGSFIESFPLFGYDLSDYDELFSENLELLLQIRENETVNWKGKHRPEIQNRKVFPRALQQPIPVWVAVGGTPESAARAGSIGLPMALAIIGGQPARFAPFAKIHRQSALREGHNAPPISINSHGFIAENSDKAHDIAFPAFKQTMDKIGRERGWSPMSREQFEATTTLEGANAVGNPEQIIEKILYQHEIFGHQRFLLQLSVGSVPHSDLFKSIELLGDVVAPAVRKELAD